MSLFLVISWTTALTQWGMVVHAFDPCAQGAEAEINGFWSREWVPGKVGATQRNPLS